jgi:hypothetical protein
MGRYNTGNEIGGGALLYYIIRCPKCGKAVDYQIWHIRTGLGAPIVLCSRCGTRVSTARREWADFSGFGKFRYVFLSFIYIVVCGLMGAGLGALVQINIQVWQGGPFAPESIFALPILVGALVMAFFTAWLQLYRVGSSKRRPPDASELTVTTSYWNPHVNLQFKVPATLLVIAVLLALPLAYKFVSLKFLTEKPTE